MTEVKDTGAALPAGMDFLSRLQAFLARYGKVIALNLAYLATTYFGSSFLLKLGGAALWLPTEWREVVRMLGTTIALAFFNLALNRPQPRVSPHQLAPSESRPEEDAKRRDLAEKAAHRERERRRYVVSTRALCGSAVALALYMFLRSHCVIPWVPPDSFWTSYQGQPLPSFIDAPARAQSDSITFLRPIWYGPNVQELLDLYAKAGEVEPLMKILDEEPERLIEAQRGSDAARMGATVIAFFLLFGAILCQASYGIGAAFSVVDEVGLELAKVVGGQK